MNEIRHTPGPWHIENKGNLHGPSARIEVVAEGQMNGGQICTIRGLSNVAYADAQLIAAAPDLKDELTELCFKAGSATNYLRSAVKGMRDKEARIYLMGFILALENRLTSSRDALAKTELP